MDCIRFSVRQIGRLVFCITCLVLLTGCQSTELAEGFDKQTIQDSAEELINKVQMDGAKKVLTEFMREDFAEKMDMDTMENTVLNLTKGKGDFVAYTAESVIGKYHKEAKEDFGIAVITASYEKGEIIYTITYDLDMKVVGFYAQ